MDDKLPNIIFLDMDGVICTPRASIATGESGLFSYLDPVACHLVKRLCVEHSAQIVISSAWRIVQTKRGMEGILGAACPGLGSMIYDDEQWWRTEGWIAPVDESTSDRGREIQHWITNNLSKFNNYIILDDMADMRPLQDRLILCDCYDGIGYEQYFQAKEILGFS